MSTFEEALSEAPPAEVDPPSSVEGQVETEGTPAPEPNRFNPSDYADHLVTVKIDGEDVEVPVGDLVNGYSRQADYTRKTQALSAREQELANAEAIWRGLQDSPAETLAYLQGQLASSPVAAEPEFDPVTDPHGAELHALRLRQQATDSYIAGQQLEQTLGRLQATYGESFVASEVVEEARKSGVQDFSQLESVYYTIMGRKAVAQQRAQLELDGKSAAQSAAITAAKQAVAESVSGGSSALGGGAPVEPQYLTPADAYRAAVAAHS